MVLFVSAAFEKKFGCPVSHAGECPTQTGRMNAWSCHFVRIGRKSVVVAMHDASLFTLVLPTAGMRGFDGFLVRLVERVGEKWIRRGLPFDPNDQRVMVLRRSDRSRIGSMNDMVQMMRFYHELARDEGSEVDFAEMERRSNETPYKSIGYNSPSRLLAELGERG
ncbi:MAG: hypothetical protein AAGI48_05545 [Verrucomicrobiota bacterium]